MSLFQRLIFISFLFFLAIGFSQCTSAKQNMKISETINISIQMKSQVYFQNWIAGIKGGGSGTNLFISASILTGKKPFKAWFKGKSANIETTKVNNVDFYVAYFKGDSNQLKDYTMEADVKQEYGNKIPVKKEVFPFDLLENEAVISYKENDKTKYLKLTNISQKEMLAYPSAPRK